MNIRVPSAWKEKTDNPCELCKWMDEVLSDKEEPCVSCTALTEGEGFR